jgi:hypothetical protein
MLFDTMPIYAIIFASVALDVARFDVGSPASYADANVGALRSAEAKNQTRSFTSVPPRVVSKPLPLPAEAKGNCDRDAVTPSDPDNG